MLAVYYTEEYVDEKGDHWFSINGNMHYSLSSGWTKESAIADYTSAEGYQRDMESTMQAFGYYN